MRQDQYDANFDNSLGAIQYILEHPIKASLKSYLPSFIASHKKITTFQIATQLCKMGLEKCVPEMLDILNVAGDSAAKLQALQIYLYRVFHAVAGVENAKEHQASLKALKKLIHQFSRENEFPCRLFKLNKLKIHLEKQIGFHQELKSFEDACRLHEDSRFVSVKEVKKYQKNKVRRGELNAIVEGIGCDQAELERQLAVVKRLKDEGRPYAWIPDQRIKSVYSVEERAARKKAKSRLSKVSLVVSSIVGVGEGMVAAVFAAASWPLLLSILIVGIPALTCNYFLFRSDSFEILKDIWFGKIWKKPNGDPLTRSEKVFVGSSLLFSLGAACAFGFVSFGSGMTGITGLVTMTGIAANPVGVMVVAAFVAFVTAAALFTVFSYMTVSWVRNGGPAKLKEKILNLPREFIKFWKHENWSDLSVRQRMSHCFQKGVQGFCKLVFGLAAIAAVILVNVATTGLFKHKAATIFHKEFGLSAKAANILSYVLIVGLGGLVNWAFYSRSILSVARVVKVGVVAPAKGIAKVAVGLAMAVRHPQRSFRAIRKGVVSGAKAVLRVLRHPKRTVRSLKKRLSNWSGKIRRVRTVHKVISAIKRCFLFSCVAMNSYGQGSGVRHDPVARKWAHDVVPTEMAVDGVMNMTALAAGSGGANAMACYKATAVPEEVGDIQLETVEAIRGQQEVRREAAVSRGVRAWPRFIGGSIVGNRYALMGGASDGAGLIDIEAASSGSSEEDSFNLGFGS